MSIARRVATPPPPPKSGEPIGSSHSNLVVEGTTSATVAQLLGPPHEVLSSEKFSEILKPLSDLNSMFFTPPSDTDTVWCYEYVEEHRGKFHICFKDDSVISCNVIYKPNA